MTLLPEAEMIFRAIIFLSALFCFYDPAYAKESGSEKSKSIVGKPVKVRLSYKKTTDDCAKFMGVPVQCLWVTYKFEGSGTVESVNADNKSYTVEVRKLTLRDPSFVSVKYLQYKKQAISEAESKFVNEKVVVSQEDIFR